MGMVGLGNEMCDAAGIVEILSLKNCGIRFSTFYLPCGGRREIVFDISVIAIFKRWGGSSSIDPRGWELGSE